MKGWYSRGYLPHFDSPCVPQVVTFRLADSMPTSKLEEWREELRLLPPEALEAGMRKRIEHYLDQGHGSAVLRRPDIAQIVEETLRRWDGERYALHAWVIMPNHVHALLTVAEGHELPKVIHSWKSFTATAANRLLGRRGALWQREYWDRFMRDGRHYEAALSYIEGNPVQARLCERPEDWRFGSARLRAAGATEDERQGDR